MTNFIDTKSIFKLHPFAELIIKKLKRSGFEAFLIGGVVRDGVLASLGKRTDFQPKEVDIATSALPEDIKKAFKGYKIVEVGEAFGVLVIVSPSGEEYEVATFRVEGEYDGRWPSKVKLVRSLKEDVKRRDFTINGLAATQEGRVIDHVGGVQDLKSRVVRAIGDPRQRLEEDHLRILRAVRFACAIDGQIEQKTGEAILNQRKKILKISAERIRDELLKILSKRAAKGIRLLDEYGILELILPEVAALKGVIQPQNYSTQQQDIYTHTLFALEAADRFGFDPLVKLAVLLHDIGKPRALKRSGDKNTAGHDVIGEGMAEGVCRRLRMSKAEIKTIKYLIRQHLRVVAFPQMSRGKQVKFLKEGENPQGGYYLPQRFPLFTKLLQVLICDCVATPGAEGVWVPVVRETVKALINVKEVDELTKARRLITGHDILKLGVKEGPEVGRILNQIQEDILAGKIKTREQALREAKRLVGA